MIEMSDVYHKNGSLPERNLRAVDETYMQERTRAYNYAAETGDAFLRIEKALIDNEGLLGTVAANHQINQRIGQQIISAEQTDTPDAIAA